jgi:hypothetical protein
VKRRYVIACIAAAAFALAAFAPLHAQLPLTTPKSSGQSVTPAYEGWYKNADGTFTLSFGYYNRNASEVVEVPVGQSNFVSPGAQNQGQPGTFHPGRHWGVFGVKVPANFGQQKEVTWTLSFRGQTFAIPGMLHPNWQIDALEGEAGSGNTPPVLRFGDAGPEGSGPGGVTGPLLTGRAGQPVQLSVFVKDDGRGATSVASGGRGAAPPITIAWFKHQGPGTVEFQPATGRGVNTGTQITTAATFGAPGEYIVRVRANDSSVAGAGHAQCCWSNGFVKVTITRQP